MKLQNLFVCTFFAAAVISCQTTDVERPTQPIVENAVPRAGTFRTLRRADSFSTVRTKVNHNFGIAAVAADFLRKDGTTLPTGDFTWNDYSIFDLSTMSLSHTNTTNIYLTGVTGHTNTFRTPIESVNLMPLESNVYDIGQAGLPYRSGYLQTLHAYSNIYVNDGVGIGVNTSIYGLAIHGGGGSIAGIHFWNDDTGETNTTGFFVGLDANEDAYLRNYESGKPLKFGSGGSMHWEMDGSGDFVPFVSNFVDVGELATPVAVGYFSTNGIYLGGYNITRSGYTTTAGLAASALQNETGTLATVLSRGHIALSDILSGSSNTYTLGASTDYWQAVYAKTVYVDGASVYVGTSAVTQASINSWNARSSTNLSDYNNDSAFVSSNAVEYTTAVAQAASELDDVLNRGNQSLISIAVPELTRSNTTAYTGSNITIRAGKSVFPGPGMDATGGTLYLYGGDGEFTGVGNNGVGGDVIITAGDGIGTNDPTSNIGGNIYLRSGTNAGGTQGYISITASNMSLTTSGAMTLTDSLTVKTSVVTQASINNWNDAYGWGDWSTNSLVGSNSVEYTTTVNFAASALQPYENTYTVAKSGGDYTTIQAALDAHPTANTLFEVYPGTYAGDTIHFTANNQSVRGEGIAPAEVKLTSGNSNIIDFAAYTGCRVYKIKAQITNATALVHVVQGAAGSCNFSKCHITMHAGYQTAGQQPCAYFMDGNGSLKIKRGTVDYEHTGTVAAIKAAIGWSNNAPTIGIDKLTINVDGANSSTACTIMYGTGAADVDIDHSDGNLTDLSTTVPAGIYIGGAATNEYRYNSLHVVGGGANAYGIYSGGAGSIRGMHNHIHVTGSSSNYSYYRVGAADIVSAWEDIKVTNGVRGSAGTFVQHNSPNDGDGKFSGTVEASDGSYTGTLATVDYVDNEIIDYWGAPQDAGTGTNLTLLPTKLIVQWSPTSTAQFAMSTNAGYPRASYTLRVFSTNSITWDSAITVDDAITPTGTNIYTLQPDTSTTNWRVLGRAL